MFGLMRRLAPPALSLLPAFLLTLLPLMPISIAHAGVSNTGRWTPTPHWDWGDNRTAVHLMLIPGSTPDSSRILWYDGDSYTSPFRGGMWGWSSGSNLTCESVAGTGFVEYPIGDDPPYDVFCNGHVQLSDKRMLMTGGTEYGEVGVRNAVTFDPFGGQNKWTALALMNDRRWYPTNTRLGDGRVFVASGSKYAQMRIFGGRQTFSSGAADKSVRRLGLNLGGTWESAKSQLPANAPSDWKWPDQLRFASLAGMDQWIEGDGFFPRTPGTEILFGGETGSGSSWVVSGKTYVLSRAAQRGAADEDYYFTDAADNVAPPGGLARSGQIATSDNIPVVGGGNTYYGLIVFGGRDYSGPPALGDV